MKKKYHIVQLSSGEIKVISYFIPVKSGKNNSSESVNDNSSELQESDTAVVNEPVAICDSSCDKQCKTKYQCYKSFKSFKRTLKRYNYIAKNHAFPRLKSGYVFSTTFTLALPINSFNEMQDLCKRFESSMRRSKMFEGTNFKFIRFIENSLKNTESYLLQPHVHYLLIGDAPLKIADCKVEQHLVKKWDDLSETTGTMHSFRRIETKIELNKAVDYLTDYCSSKDSAIKKRRSLISMPCKFNPITSSRSLDKPIELRCEFNPYENEDPTFKSSTLNPFYDEYLEYDK